MENTTTATATETTATAAAAPVRLVGWLDPHIFNTHLRAACKDDTRKALKGISFRVNGGVLHVTSTDGRVLLHTVLAPNDNDWSLTDGFDVIVEARKIPCKAGDYSCKFCIEGDRFEMTTSKGVCIIPLVKDQVYPNYEEAELDWDNAEYPRRWEIFDPDYLAIVRDYVGEIEYRTGNNLRAAVKGWSPFAWRVSSAYATRTANIMPLRVA